MDWAANLYGLSKAFYNSTNVGGGVIQVSQTVCAFFASQRIHDMWLADQCVRWCGGSNRRREIKIPIPLP